MPKAEGGGNAHAISGDPCLEDGSRQIFPITSKNSKPESLSDVSDLRRLTVGG